MYQSPLYGPVLSRRLGISLGINTAPADGKVCTFDCIYCECGLNADHRTHSPRPTRAAIRRALEEYLLLPHHIDDISFAGNGEPTAHPDFAGIVGDVLYLRDKYRPQATVTVISNATMLHRPDVVQALLRVDNNMQKLDTVTPEYIARVNQPHPGYDIGRVVEQLCQFHGRVIVQTMFLEGTDRAGQSVSNTDDQHLLPWLEALRTIQPQRVVAYTIDRPTPVPTLRKPTPETMHRICQQVQALGIPCQAY